MMVPMSLVSSSGSPSLSALTFCPSASRKLSKMSRCRKRREPAGQDWLCLVKRIAAIISSTTPTSFASGKTIQGPFPPSFGAPPAQFERHRHDAVRGSAHNELAALRRAGEGELAYHRVVGERSATFLAEPSQHVEHARRQEFLTYFSEHQDAERCILCGLQDERVAGAKRGADLQSSQ